MQRRAFILLAALVLLGPLAVAAQQPSVVVFVVRHAERAEDGTNDPPISEIGQERARLVAGMLAEARLTHIHTTDFKRTRSTVEPTAQATGLTPRLYDPQDLQGFADRLRATPGRHLVVGHSNTNTGLVEALQGNPGAPIGEMEYDRGYVVVVLPAGDTGSAIFRFGG
jgi:broad specificity phosphatase PhoE